jgi:hypothetical protein
MSKSVTISQQRKNQPSVIYGQPEDSQAYSSSSAIVLTIGASGAAIPVGKAGEIEIPFDCMVTGWTILESTGIASNITIDIRRASYDQYPSFLSIAGTEKPMLAGAIKNRDLEIPSWSGELSRGDIIAAYVESNSGAEIITLSIRVTKI